MHYRRFVLASFIVAGGIASPAAAQSRPLPVELVEGVGGGNVSLQAGMDYARDVRFTLSGLEGNLLRVALVRIDVGLSSMADLEISGGLRDHLAIVSTTPAVLSDQLRLPNASSTGAFDDIIIGTKIRLLEERAGEPGFAIRVATRLPNAKHPSGLGQDTTDFYSSLAVEQSIAAAHIAVNVGLGILGDPLLGNRHVDSLLYGVMLSHLVSTRTTLIAAIEGRSGTIDPGLEPRAGSRAGVVWTRGPTRLEVDGTLGLTNRDGNVGVAVNAGYTFHAFAP